MATIKFQKAAAAILVCAPSNFHHAFVTTPDDWRTILRDKTEFDLSQEALDAIEPILDKIKNDSTKVDALVLVKGLLKRDFWDGDEPHPSDPDARAMVTKARELDGGTSRP